MKLLIGLVGITFSIFAQATSVEITAVHNASNYIEGVTPVDTPIIYGAIVGEPCQGQLGSLDFCNNCTGSEACSERRIHPNLVLKIEFKVTAQNFGWIALGTFNEGVFTIFPAHVYSRSTLQPLGEGDTGSVEIKWGELCRWLAEDPSCSSTSVFKNLFVAISSDAYITPDEAQPIQLRMVNPNEGYDVNEISCAYGGDGICSFVASPGNGAVYIDMMSLSGSFPVVNGISVKALRVFYSDVQGASVTDLDYSFPYFDLPVSFDGQVQSTVVPGLTNGKYYGFKIAVVDEAMNVSMLTSNDQIFAECQNSTILGAADDSICAYIAQPMGVPYRLK